MAYTPSFYYPNNNAQNFTGNMYPYYGQTNIPQASYAPAPTMQPSQNGTGIIWVDGEAAAKAYQIPAGISGPVALWDTNDQVIYLKSMNQMGMPNPLQKIHYQMEEPPQVLPAGQNGQTSGNEAPAHAYVTKDDLAALKNELKEMIKQSQASINQNGSQNGRNADNRGGNR